MLCTIDMTYLPDSWQTQKCHPTQDCGNDIFLPLLIATSQLVADARKEDNLPACGEDWVNTVDMTLLFFFSPGLKHYLQYNTKVTKYLQRIHYYSTCPPKNKM